MPDHACGALWDAVMVALVFRCPTTQADVDIGIETDPNSLSMIRLFTVRGECAACGKTHEWSVLDAKTDGSAVAVDRCAQPAPSAPQRARP